jgi:hypothetical protein
MTKLELLNQELERNYQLRRLLLTEWYEPPRQYVPDATLKANGFLDISGSEPPYILDFNDKWTQLVAETGRLHLLIEEVDA